MNVLLKKEIRMLLPSFLIGLALAFSFLLLPRNRPNSVWDFLIVLPMMCCPAMVVMMSLDSFGRELSAGAFPGLLVQPMSRERLWWIKTGLLFGAVLIILSAWWISFLLGWPTPLTPEDIHHTLLATGLFALTAYSGGLWTVLLLRQVGTAFWFTLLVPAGLIAGLANFLPERYSEHLTFVIVTSLVVYSIAGFLFAWRLFLRAQDTQWTGATISLPRWRVVPALLTGAGVKRRRRPLAAMFARECQLHQPQLLIAGGLALLHLGVLAARAIGSNRDSMLGFVLGHFWYLWLVMPLLVGCAAVAEERKLGTLEGELCLPARRRKQFFVKLVVTLLFSVLLGAVMPLLLEGTKILPNTDLNSSFRAAPEVLTGTLARTFVSIVHWVLMMSGWFGLILFAAICAGIGALAFYCSTLSRHTLQALGPTLLGIFVTVFLLFQAYLPDRITGVVLWRGFLVYLIGVPTLILTFVWLAYWNYRRVLAGWPVWRRNLLALLAAFSFVIATTAALYHRAWELFMPLEPAHGPARLAASARVTLQSEFLSVTVQLPDGKVWSGDFGYSMPSLTAYLTSGWQLKEAPHESQFLTGTNWASVADCIFDTVGIRTDGSLWVSAKSLPRQFYLTPARIPPQQSNRSPFSEVGDGHHWKSVISLGRNALLLKDDGTLWAWGTNQPNGTNGWPGLITYPIEQVGTDSDWAAVERISQWFYLRKQDGRAWSNINPVNSDDRHSFNVFGFAVARSQFLDQHQWRGVAWADATRSVLSGFLVGVRDDGTFRVLAGWELAGWENSQLTTHDVELGRDTTWVGVTGFDNDVVFALKADGSLWRWSFTGDPRTSPESAIAVRLGRHSDWLALGSIPGGIVALSADGGLWYWRFNSSHFYDTRELLLSPLIGVSRRPVRIAGLFDGPK